MTRSFSSDILHFRLVIPPEYARCQFRAAVLNHHRIHISCCCDCFSKAHYIIIFLRCEIPSNLLKVHRSIARCSPVVRRTVCKLGSSQYPCKKSTTTNDKSRNLSTCNVSLTKYRSIFPKFTDLNE